MIEWSEVVKLTKSKMEVDQVMILAGNAKLWPALEVETYD